MDYKRISTEDIDTYRLRLCKNKDLYDLSWQDIAELMFAETGEKKSPDVFRKSWRYFNEGYEAALRDSPTASDAIDELEEQKIELVKEKTKFQDQKREYMNLIKNQARFEHIQSEINKAILEVAKEKPLQWSKPEYREVKSKTGILLLSDWHVGSEFSNSFNSYNIDIFKSRVATVVEKAIKDGKRNNIEKLIIVNLGDALNGLIHVSTRVMSSENVVRQIQIAAETLAEVLCKVANEFKEIKFINMIGNHSRAISNKNDALPKENFEKLIPWFIESRLSHIKNLEIVTDTDGYVLENIARKNVVFVHGDLDHVQGCVKSIPQLLGIVPHMILMGHIHHNTLTEHGTTTVHSSGSLMGSDDYAVAKRYFSKPSQKFIVLDESEDDEIIYTYNL
jgi:hypothetical protein